MHLLTLDKKLQIVNHRITKEEIIKIADQHKVEVQEIEKELRRQMLIKFMPALEKNFEVQRIAEDDNVTYSVRGYILSERQLYETLLEVLELDSVFVEKLKASIHNYLGFQSQ